MIENATTVMASTMQSKSERPEYKAMLEHYSTEQLNFKYFSQNHNKNEYLTMRDVYHAIKRDE